MLFNMVKFNVQKSPSNFWKHISKTIKNEQYYELKNQRGIIIPNKKEILLLRGIVLCIRSQVKLN